MDSIGFTFKVAKKFSGKKLDELRRRVQAMNAQVKVGYPANGATENDGTPLALVAMVNNFGSPEHNIPERPFMTRAIQNHKEDFKAVNEKTLPQVLEGKMSVKKALSLLGTEAVKHIQAEIRNGDFVALKVATIKRKGSSRPLFDTGQMLRGVTYEVDEK